MPSHIKKIDESVQVNNTFSTGLLLRFSGSPLQAENPFELLPAQQGNQNVPFLCTILINMRVFLFVICRVPLLAQPCKRGFLLNASTTHFFSFYNPINTDTL